MAKTYIPILSYRNKVLNGFSHAGSYIAFISLIILGFANVFASAIPENIVTIGTYAGLIGFLGGMACVGIVWVIAKIMTKKARKAIAKRTK